jgi:large subunit ribosomal protein L15
MLKLHELRKNPKSMHRRKVVGRGLGSGKGTYATRGNKGQTKRTGHSKMPANFEGGRQPLVRQLPKSRGFTSLNDKPTPVSLTLLAVFDEGATVDLKALQSKKIVDIMTKKVKILGGEIKKKLIIKLPISKSATEAVVKAGGKII